MHTKKSNELDKFNAPEITRELRQLLRTGDQVFIFNTPEKLRITWAWNNLKTRKDGKKYNAKIHVERFVCFSTEDEEKVIGFLVTRRLDVKDTKPASKKTEPEKPKRKYTRRKPKQTIEQPTEQTIEQPTEQTDLTVESMAPVIAQVYEENKETEKLSKLGRWISKISRAAAKD